VDNILQFFLMVLTCGTCGLPLINCFSFEELHIGFIFFVQVENIEKFALLLSEHFLSKYRHVINTQIYIEEVPWKRISVVCLKNLTIIDLRYSVLSTHCRVQNCFLIFTILI
jgi:hypothetical protein